MTVQQMHQQFKDELDKVDSLVVPNYTSLEIDRMLNENQERYIKERLPMSRTKVTTVEETQRRADDLSTLTREFNTVTFVQNFRNKPNGVFVTLPADYKYTLDQTVSVTYTDSCGNLINPLPNFPSKTDFAKNGTVFQCTHNQFAKLINDPFHKPIENEVLQLPFGDVVGTSSSNDHPQKTIELIHGPGVTINAYFLRYLKEPRQIELATNTTCELGISQSKEIVKMAVAEVLKVIGDPRYNIQKAELAVTE